MIEIGTRGAGKPLATVQSQQDPVVQGWVAPARDGDGVRIGVVGCGYWGSKHVRVLSGVRNVSEVVLIDSNPRTRWAMLSAFPAARAFADLDSALPYIDAAIIAVPPRSHAELAFKALQAGKHVLVEKPLAPSLAEAQALVVEAGRSKGILMVGHTFEFNPAVRELRNRFDRGELGELYYILSARLNLGLYQSDVNVVWDLAPHDVSILNFLLRSTPVTVTAWGASHADADLEDLAFIQLKYEQPRVTGYVHISWLDPKKVRRVTVVGSKKMAVYDDMAEERLRIFDRGIERAGPELAAYERPVSYRYGDIVSPHIPFAEPLSLEDQHFVDCICNGTDPLSDGRSGLAVVAVLEAIDLSLRTRTPVAVDRSILRLPTESRRECIARSRLG
jgi:predicted dehydrogenase